jgi:hypothetical protein
VGACVGARMELSHWETARADRTRCRSADVCARRRPLRGLSGCRGWFDSLSVSRRDVEQTLRQLWGGARRGQGGLRQTSTAGVRMPSVAAGLFGREGGGCKLRRARRETARTRSLASWPAASTWPRVDVARMLRL